MGLGADSLLIWGAMGASTFLLIYAIVLYFLWMGVCMNTSRIVEMVEAAQTGSGPLAWALTVPAVVWISVGSAALAAMVYGIVHMGMKQMVR